VVIWPLDELVELFTFDVEEPIGVSEPADVGGFVDVEKSAEFDGFDEPVEPDEFGCGVVDKFCEAG